MQIGTLREKCEVLNGNFNHSKWIRSFWMQIRTIQKGFEAFECKFKSFERGLKHSNPNSNHSTGHSNANSKLSKGFWSFWMPILTIRKGLEPYKCKSNHLNVIQSIPMQIQTIRKAFEAFKSKFEPFKRDLRNSNPNSNHSKGIRMQILTIRKGIRTVRMQIRSITKGFKAFESTWGCSSG